MSSSAAQSPHTRRGFHLASDLATIARAGVSSLPSPSPDGSASDPFPTYTFQNFYHPLIGSLIQQLNTGSIADMLDPEFLQSLTADFFTTEYQNITGISQPYPANDIDVSIGGPYANYNWELLYHLPVAVAVHLSQNQRFAEAQQWFHLVFDPTSTDMNVPEPGRYWKSFVFRAAYGPGSAGPSRIPPCSWPRAAPRPPSRAPQAPGSSTSTPTRTPSSTPTCPRRVTRSSPQPSRRASRRCSRSSRIST